MTTAATDKQGGQSMVEFVIIFPALILLTLGTFQIALIYSAKSTLNYATFNAARSGAVNNAQKESIENALFRGLAPLFTSVEEVSLENSLANVQALKGARERARSINDDGFICIQRVNPSPEAFTDFGVTEDGMIPNDNLMYRSAQLGGASQISIQDANLLKLRVTYCHRMIVPFFPKLLQAMVNGSDPDGLEINIHGNEFMRNCYNNGRIPIVSQAIVRMQSDISNDSFPECDKVLP